MEGFRFSKKLKDLVAPVYWDYVIRNFKNTTQIVFGGSSSGKSYAIAQRVVLDTLRGRNTLVIRKTSNSLRTSCLNEIISKIQSMGLSSIFKVSSSDFTITCIENNRQIIFKGLDDPEKIKSIKPSSGVITDIWIEEATQISYDDFKLLTTRLRGGAPFVKRITMSFNPILKTHWIYQKFFDGVWLNNTHYIETENVSTLKSTSRVSILKTTYRDNPFLSADDIARIEGEDDPYYQDVYVNGNWGSLGGQVFTNYCVEDFNKENFKEYRYGLDWGFATDPFAFLKLAIDIKKRVIWICDEIYQSGLLNDDSIPLVKKLFKYGTIWADSAEPKSIKEYRNNGLNARPVKKGSGSVIEGINFLKRFKIIIHPTCINTYREFSSYHYKTDRRTGETLPEPVGENDHLIDCCRYAVESDMAMNGYIKDLL